MNVRHIALVRASVLGEIRQRLERALADWASAWGLEGQRAEIACIRAWEAPASQRPAKWQQRAGRDGRELWFARHHELVKALQKQMFPPDQRIDIGAGGADIARTGAQQCAAALLAKLGAALGLKEAAAPLAEQDALDERLYGRTSGAVMATIQAGDAALCCLLHPALTRELDKAVAKPVLAPIARDGLARAMGNIPVTLTVEADHIEMDVASLMSLARGDILRLNKPIDQPLSVLEPDGRPLCGAYLGHMDGSLAIEVVRNK